MIIFYFFNVFKSLFFDSIGGMSSSIGSSISTGMNFRMYPPLKPELDRPIHQPVHQQIHHEDHPMHHINPRQSIHHDKHELTQSYIDGNHPSPVHISQNRQHIHGGIMQSHTGNMSIKFL